MRIIKIERPSININGCVTNDIETAIEELRMLFNEDSKGEKVIFTAMDMTKEEFEKIDEFQGW